MTLTRTLWDFLDSREAEPEEAGLEGPGFEEPRLEGPRPEELGPAILDSRDPEVEGAYFGDRSQRVRWRVGITSAVALGTAVLLVVVGSFFFQSATPAPEVVLAAERSPDDRATTGGGLPEVSPPQVVVHVVGAVVSPGVVRVPESSRVEDVLALVGGPTESAELSGVNLARVVFDGEQIVVPTIGEAASQGAGVSGGLISLSRADSTELQSLPRVGPATAERIISWREANGPFRSVEDLLAVSGIGPATLEGLREFVTP